MNIKILKNESGIISGVVIPAQDLDAAKASIKPDSELYNAIRDVLQDNTDQSEIVLPNDKTIGETELEAQTITRTLYAEAFRKGIPMFYKDQRTPKPKEFVRANPDGSEDLVCFDAQTRSYTIIRNLATAGKGYWSYLVSA